MKESQPVLMTDQALQTLVEKISIVFFQKPLDFNPTVFLKYGQEELEKVIKHELCHYHLHLAGKGYQHKDKDFKELLAKTGGARYAPPLVERKKAVFHQYQCQSCGEVILRKRRIDTTRYVCGKCHGRLSWQAKKEQI